MDRLFHTIAIRSSELPPHMSWETPKTSSYSSLNSATYGEARKSHLRDECFREANVSRIEARYPRRDVPQSHIQRPTKTAARSLTAVDVAKALTALAAPSAPSLRTVSHHHMMQERTIEQRVMTCDEHRDGSVNDHSPRKVLTHSSRSRSPCWAVRCGLSG
ncbi:hypothetical protein BCV70DRAFT_62766 [Testicularia cyperi]|uniref:Uncharacterized protein n=1 Tax=Testicularia cyperi TaxID=1882483 RepID=A0A317XYC1_9BASI|nr:hypothetical protein BCV70DRAFT_62766 [Testicularia cyperi]